MHGSIHFQATFTYIFGISPGGILHSRIYAKNCRIIPDYLTDTYIMLQTIGLDHPKNITTG